jgi:hypothetical protein
VEQNYTIILGSHRNSKLKIEKNGDEKASVSRRALCSTFSSCWPWVLWLCCNLRPLLRKLLCTNKLPGKSAKFTCIVHAASTVAGSTVFCSRCAAPQTQLVLGRNP